MFVWTKEELDEDQAIAIREPKSVFLEACPGSGKTRTLTHKIADQLSKLTSEKQFAVAITYTHRAADQISERIEALGVDTSQLWIGTIHSFCLEWILRPYGIYLPELKHGFRLMDNHEREKLFTEICEPYRNPRVTHWDCQFYFTEDTYEISASKQSLHSSLRKIVDQYLHHLEENHLIDFELILFYAYRLLKSQPKISQILSKIFPSILIDEYQDTKRIQYQIIASILRAGQGGTRTFIVGDRNQAIFNGLGGYPISREEFEEMGGLELVPLQLTKNYRSSKKIISLFNTFSLKESVVQAASKDREYPSLISYDKITHTENLVSELARLIKNSVENLGITQNEICVISPQWIPLAAVTRQLAADLPEYEFDGPGLSPFGRDRENFWFKVSRVALTSASPRMYIRRMRWAGEILTDLEDCGLNFSGITRRKLLKICNSISIDEDDGLAHLTLFFEQFLSKLQLEMESHPWLHEHHKAFFEKSNARIVTLRNKGSESITSIAGFRRVFRERTGITMSTIHGVKGAEFDTVIAFGLLEGMLPHFDDQEAHASATKLLYVIASRAKKNLHLISETNRPRGRRDIYQPTKRLLESDFDFDSI